MPTRTARRARPKNLSSKNSEFALFEQIREDVDSGKYDQSYNRIQPLVQNSGSQVQAIARQVVTKLILTNDSKISVIDGLEFALSCNASTSSLPGYATLDEQHTNAIGKVRDSIIRYVDDRSKKKRPKNYLLIASPGSGKSYLIDRLAASLSHKNIVATSFNMASMQSSHELLRPIEQARNTKVADKIPLVFLDEFDSLDQNYATLLPLLWDGSISLGDRDLQLGTSIFILAGSKPVLPRALAVAKSMKARIKLPRGTNPKLIDLLSRINGLDLRIPPLCSHAEKSSRQTDIVVVAVQLLKNRFGRSLLSVPVKLLRFLSKLNYRYDSRSLANIIESIPFAENTVHLTLDMLQLPFGSLEEFQDTSLPIHLIDRNGFGQGVVDCWNSLRCDDSILVTAPIVDLVGDVADQKFTLAHKLHDLNSSGMGGAI